MPSLCDMPAEIILEISRNLRTQDLGNARLASKRTEAAIFKPFAREFFSKKQFMFTEPSLRVLIDISKHPSLGPSLKHLVLGLDHYRYDLGFSWPNDPRKKRLFNLGRNGQLNFMYGGVARDMLASAIKNLVNLETVDIRDFRSFTRHRDQDAWRSYGATTVLRETGVELATHPSLVIDRGSASFPSQAFAIVIQAIAQAAGEEIGQGLRRGIDIETVIRDMNWGLQDLAFALPDYTRDLTTPVLKGIKKLHLCLDMEADFYSVEQVRDPDTRDTVCVVAGHLRSFLCEAQNVEWLRINFPHRHVDNHAKALRNWISLRKPLPSVPFYNAPLKRVDLGHDLSTVDECLAVFRKFQDTLEALSIWNAALVLTNDEHVAETNKMAELFQGLAKLPHLKEVVLGRISLWNGFRISVNFADEKGRWDRDNVEYRGDRAREFLIDLVDRILVNWPSESDRGSFHMSDPDSFMSPESTSDPDMDITV